MRRAHPIATTSVFVPGGWDAAALLVLRCLRSGALLVVVVGVWIAYAAGRVDNRLSDQVSTVSGLLHSLATPLGVLAAGVALRILVAPAAYLLSLAFVAGRGGDVVGTSDRRSHYARWSDRLKVAGAVRALRWTAAVRDDAVASLGTSGAVLRWADVVMRVATVVVAVLFLAVLVARG